MVLDIVSHVAVDCGVLVRLSLWLVVRRAREEIIEETQCENPKPDNIYVCAGERARTLSLTGTIGGRSLERLTRTELVVRRAVGLLGTCYLHT